MIRSQTYPLWEANRVLSLSCHQACIWIDYAGDIIM